VAQADETRHLPDFVVRCFRLGSIDLVLAMPARWGIGFALPNPEAVPDIPDGKICYWGGWGGSMAVMDTDRRTTFAYVMNKMGQVTSAGTERTREYTRLIYQALR
jgi:CubicO group peptidase (beta-lactamase class C family)